MEKVNCFLGVDVSKSTLDVALLKDGVFLAQKRIDNRAKDIRMFLKETLKAFNLSLDQVLVCLEHTGIYNYTILEVLSKLDVKTCVESALQIKKSQGIVRGKSDQIDARRIALYAAKNCNELRIWKPQRSTLTKLQALLSVRERLIKARTQLNTPLKELAGYLSSTLVRSLKLTSKDSIQAINKDLKRLEKQIDELVSRDQNLTTQFNQASSVPGIGKVTALYMIMVTGEFERINKPKSLACHAGVAPFPHLSGSSIRGRTRVSRLANMTLKKLLHMAAMSAIQYSDEIRSYYLRKLAQGKNKMSVINAVRNKLITRVYSCIKDGRLYSEEYQNTLA